MATPQPSIRLKKASKMIDYATFPEWHAWLRHEYHLPESVLSVMVADFEKKTRKLCPERLDASKKFPPSILRSPRRKSEVH